MKHSIPEIRQILAEKIPQGIVKPDHDDSGHYYIHVPSGKRSASVTTKSGILDMPHLKQWVASETVKYIDKHWDSITPENKEEKFTAAKQAHRDIFEDAGDVGTKGHNVIEKYLKEWMRTKEKPNLVTDFMDEFDKRDVRITAICRSAQLFFDDFDVYPIASEMYVFSEKHVYGGTLDSLMVLAEVVEKGDRDCKHDYWYSGPSHKHERCIHCHQKIRRRFALVDFKTSNSIDKPEYPMQGSAYKYALKEMSGLNPEIVIIVRFDKFRAKYDVVQVCRPYQAFHAFKHCTKVYDWLNNGKLKTKPLQEKEVFTI